MPHKYTCPPVPCACGCGVLASPGMRFVRGHNAIRPDILKYIESKLIQSGECRLWTGKLTKKGYGQTSYQGRSWYVHRLLWTLRRGPIPEGMLLCHTCDHRNCGLEAHHFLGTPRANMRDMIAKGRERHNNNARGEVHGSRLHPERIKHGDNHPSSKLTDAQALDILGMYRDAQPPYKEVGDIYGVSASTIFLIVKHRIRKHLHI